jgi:hypothetical protein
MFSLALFVFVPYVGCPSMDCPLLISPSVFFT